jgi:cellulose biosynthesis protein BcsQ
MKIISVQSQSGGTGVTLTAAELALTAKAEGLSVLAVDTSPWKWLQADIEEAGFYYLDDVRQLFRPAREARWHLNLMPQCAILYHPEILPVFPTTAAAPGARSGYKPEAGKSEDAAFHLREALDWFDRHYDVMIVDVVNKNKRLMQLFYDVSHEVHLMLRDTSPHRHSIASWREYIERPSALQSYPKIISHKDRQNVPGDLDKWGNSIALKPYLEAAA